MHSSHGKLAFMIYLRREFSPLPAIRKYISAFDRIELAS